jgi:hypothetical protein
MTARTWIRRLFARTPRTARKAPARCRPTLEALESRYVPSTLVVTKTTDTGVAGDGSLRGEIAAAASGDKITFADSLAGQTITLDAAKGQLELSKDLTIHGLGADQLTISGGDATRVFQVDGGHTDTITGLTIAHGNDDNDPTGGGGAIFNIGTLTLDHCTLWGNQADNSQGGGGAILNQGTLTIDHSILSQNHAEIGSLSLAGGGAIANRKTLTILHSTLSDNHADGDAGGAIDTFGFGGSLTLDDCTLSGNHADGAFGGGAIRNFGGLVTITNSKLSDNHADGGTGVGGGAILNFAGTLTLDHCTVSGNHANGCHGGGIANDSGGTLALLYSTVCDNFAATGADLFNDASHGSTVTLDHSTVCLRVDG